MWEICGSLSLFSMARTSKKGGKIFSLEELEALKLTDLKDLLKEKDLSSTGNKPVLVQRLLESQEEESLDESLKISKKRVRIFFPPLLRYHRRKKTMTKRMTMIQWSLVIKKTPLMEETRKQKIR
jgi:hypothetical protein